MSLAQMKEFYKGELKETVPLAEIESMEAEDKFKLCYEGFIEGYGEDELWDTLEKYIALTTSDWINHYSEYEPDFKDWINRLAYSYVNGIHGTPFSLV